MGVSSIRGLPLGLVMSSLVETRDNVWIVAELSDIPRRQPRSQPAHGGAPQVGSVDVELRRQVFHPLIPETRGTENRDTVDSAAIGEFWHEYANLDALADANSDRDQCGPMAWNLTFGARGAD